MPPRRRHEGDPPPVYGVGTNYFSVQINHGGFFVGDGSNRGYLNGSVIWYDYMDTATWSPAMVENIVEDIGYEMQGRIKVHYCIPILSIGRNGLREIRSDHDTIQMSQFVGSGHRSISLYLDHDDSMGARRSIQADDNGGEVEDAPIPDKAAVADTMEGRSTNKEVEEVEDSGDEDDQDPDFEFKDSDYGISEGDDDLYADNVDEDEAQVKRTIVKGEQKIEGDGDSEQEDLWLPDSDDEKVEFRFDTFRPEDLKDPKFKSGQLFESVDLLRKAIREYSCQQRRAIKMPVNDKSMTRKGYVPGVLTAVVEALTGILIALRPRSVWS